MSINFRVNVAIFLFATLVAGMCARLGYIEMFEKDFLKDQGDARTIRMERINAHRGMIRDRSGKPLAVSSPVIVAVIYCSKEVAKQVKSKDRGC